MKRSKIFLSISACVLAFVAFAATKARTSSNLCYFTTLGGTKKVNVQCTKTNTGSNRLCTIGGKKYYTSTNCVLRAYTAS